MIQIITGVVASLLILFAIRLMACVVDEHTEKIKALECRVNKLERKR